MLIPTTSRSSTIDHVLARRLRPLLIGLFLQNMLLWVPIEKLFMTQIGFNVASIGLVAAVYATVAPVLEVPFGIIADRWSRIGIMILGTIALAASSAVGGMSTSPAIYVVAASLLGVYFALSSGMADSVVYDTVVEETGSGDPYEKWIGRVHAVEACALVASAVLGGMVAALTSTRVTYLITAPVVATGIFAFRRFREPQLHRQSERVTYRQQAAVTVRMLTTDRNLRPVIALVALVEVAATVVFEFGPLWLVSLHAPSSIYGPYWAALVSTVGFGGWLASRARLERPAVAVGLGGLLVAAALIPTLVHALAFVIVAQFAVALVASMIGVHAGRLLHDEVGAHLRAGVSSGAGTLSWLTFLPVSVVFGQVSRAHGVQTAGFLLVALALGVAALLACASSQLHDVVPSDDESVPELVQGSPLVAG